MRSRTAFSSTMAKSMAPPRFALLLLLIVFPALIAAKKLKTPTALETFLMAVQSTALQVAQSDPKFDPTKFDPKYYVDLPLKHNLSSTAASFARLANSNEAFHHFLNQSFLEPGSDLMVYNLPDFVAEPEGFLPNVTNPTARKYALEIHALWKVLARKVKPNVWKEPQQHTLLPLPHPVVVPGSRFREVYYWDTYWIIRGLVASKLYSTATSVLENLVELVNTYGFVPNGARTYYLNRSQPPLLSQMIKDLFLKNNNVSLVQRAFPALVKEHAFWSAEPHRVHIRDVHGGKHVLTRYYAMWDTPRPESFTIDNQTAQGLTNPQERAELFHQIATTAESGWDFSTRWMANRQNLTTLKTAYILPVDLNAYLLQMENNMAFFAKLLGKSELEMRFKKHVKARRSAIAAILWNEDMGQYLDYWLVKRNATRSEELNTMNKKTHDFDKKNQNTDIFPSNFSPLWCGVVLPGDGKLSKLISSFKKSGLLLTSGVTTSLKRDTGFQWDYPNAWPNIQHMLAEGFANTGLKEGIALADDISKRWLCSNYVSFQKIGVMMEKYDARYCGKSGYGGEYHPQTGFGWSNGVVLSLFERFGWPAGTNLTCPV